MTLVQPLDAFVAGRRSVAETIGCQIPVCRLQGLPALDSFATLTARQSPTAGAEPQVRAGTTLTLVLDLEASPASKAACPALLFDGRWRGFQASCCNSA